MFAVENLLFIKQLMKDILKVRRMILSFQSKKSVDEGEPKKIRSSNTQNKNNYHKSG